MTFPLPANSSLALISVTDSLLNWVQTIIATALLGDPTSANCSRRLTPFAVYVVLSAVAGAGLTALLRPDYRRARIEAGVILREDRVWAAARFGDIILSALGSLEAKLSVHAACRGGSWGLMGPC